MAATVTAPVFSPATRFLPLWTFDGRRLPVGRMHLAQPKTTTRPVAMSWCGRTLFVDAERRVITGADAVLSAWDEEQPTCALCLARVGASEWEW